MKIILEFDEEHQLEASTSLHATDLALALSDLADYKRELDKYEERSEIPVQEVIDRLEQCLDVYYKIDPFKMWD